MEKRVIGILAGMGPRSTAPFLELVIDQCKVQYGAKYDEDFPPIMIFSLPTPFYIDRPINHTVMKETIIEGLRKLESTEVSFIVMPCNSAHIYFDGLEKSIDIPLLNIVDVTIDSLPPKSQRVTIFATNATFNSELYQKGIISAGHEFIFENSWQENVNKIVQMIKVKENNQHIISYWNELISETEKYSIESIIIACTDLSILKSRTEKSQVNIIDSAEALAKAAVKRYLNK
ncbi:MAG: aspartate/glutamate racemase family protein [Desulfitobacteriaceae bacterium]